MLTQVSDQGVRESIQLPPRPRAEVEAASTETLRQWLLPADGVVVWRHRFIRPAPPSWTTVVAFDGAGTEITPGVCRYDGWFVSISPGRDPYQVTPFYRARVPQYVQAQRNDCSQPTGGLAASSDAEGTAFVQGLKTAKASYGARDSRLRCEGAVPDCAAAWLGLPPPSSASRCYDKRDCILYDFGSLQAEITGRSRPSIRLYPVTPPVF